LRRFDEGFSEILSEAGLQPEDSRAFAVQRIQEILAGG